MESLRKNILRAATGVGILTAILPVSSCLNDDDIPYPRIRANILEMEVEGQSRAAMIDTTAGTVTLFLNDSADIYALKLKKFEVTKGATVSDTTLLCRPLDLADTMRLTLHIYQDWPWAITARQEIARSFSVAGQIGPSEIDPATHTVKAYVGNKQDLRSVTVTSIKLGGSTSKIIPDINGRQVDFTSPVKVEVNEFGRTTVWTITVETREMAVELTGADAWTQVIWATANVEEGRRIAFEYRVAGTETWKAVPQEWVKAEGNGIYRARIVHLEPMTEYEVRAVSDDQNTPEERVRTGAIVQTPNNSFTNWWQDGKVWCPWSENGTPYWGTGNKGATTLGDSNTTPITDVASPTGYAGASLLTKFVGIGILGKLAAGNLFIGSYVRTDGTNGVLSFGREFKERPTALLATIKYNGTDISHSNSEYSSLKGRPDTCTVWMALTDANEPFEIRTKPSDRQLFDKNAADVLAYGEYYFSGEMDDYITVTIPLDYRSTSRIPNYIMMVASASKYGDFFTGGAGSTLLVKKLELVYDYND